jgi:hypothetical protein
MVVRTTPGHWGQIDPVLFPRLAERRAATRLPSLFWVQVHRGPGHRVTVGADAFFVPEALVQRIEQTYREYLTWWLARGNPARKRAPASFLTSRPWDYVNFVVLAEHAEWWIGLLDHCAPFTFNGFSGLNDGSAAQAQAAWEEVLSPTLVPA